MTSAQLNYEEENTTQFLTSLTGEVCAVSLEPIGVLSMLNPKDADGRPATHCRAHSGWKPTRLLAEAELIQRIAAQDWQFCVKSTYKDPSA